MSAAPEPLIGLSVTAADLESTGLTPTNDRHQFRMGLTSFIYFTPEQAQQWVSVLKTITEETSNA